MRSSSQLVDNVKVKQEGKKKTYKTTPTKKRKSKVSNESQRKKRFKNKEEVTSPPRKPLKRLSKANREPIVETSR